MGKHQHPQARIVYALAGSFLSSHGFRTLSVERGDALYRPAGDEHQDTYGTIVESLAVLLPAEDPIHAPFLMRDPAMQGLMCAVKIEWNAGDSAAGLVLEGLVTLAASVMLHRRPLQSKGRAHWITKVREQLEVSYATTPTLTELARSVDRDPAYVAATFKRIYGTSVGIYLRQCRLWQARNSIGREGASLAAIAQACGYSDQSHFTRQFKRLFSITPSEYRRRHFPALSAVL